LDVLDLREKALNCRGLILIAGNQEALKEELRLWAEKFEAAAEAIEHEEHGPAYAAHKPAQLELASSKHNLRRPQRAVAALCGQRRLSGCGVKIVHAHEMTQEATTAR
jgi:hypothetical protein